jgi:8-amino-7-oxononanoate synthase
MATDTTFELTPTTTIGLLKKQLVDRGITDVREIAGQMHRLRRMQEEANLFYSYDGYTEGGSSHAAVVSDGRRSRACTMWSINHYLGLNRHPRVIEAGQRALAEFGTGCGTSAMSGGLSSLHKQIETRIASLVGKDGVMLFSTGFTTNSGVISGLVSKRDLLLSDAENHASIVDGCRASRAQILPFAHNDVADLEDKLRRYRDQFENVFVLVESAYSMSGDLSPLREIVALKERYGFFLYVDEAHTFGFYGDRGAGYCHEQGVVKDVDFLMSTFSKATASMGGFVAMDAKYKTLLTWNARPYLFQACFTPADAAVILAALDEIEDNPEHARRLHENNALFRSLLVAAGFDLRQSRSPVVPVYVDDMQVLLKMTTELFEQGIFTIAVIYPAVGPTEGRLRFIVNATHTREEIEHTVGVLRDLRRKHAMK